MGPPHVPRRAPLVPLLVRPALLPLLGRVRVEEPVVQLFVAPFLEFAVHLVAPKLGLRRVPGDLVLVLLRVFVWFALRWWFPLPLPPAT